jgi:hypothetical protein
MMMEEMTFGRILYEAFQRFPLQRPSWDGDPVARHLKGAGLLVAEGCDWYEL